MFTEWDIYKGSAYNQLLKHVTVLHHLLSWVTEAVAFIPRTLKKYSIMENVNIYKSRKFNELSCVWPFFKITYTNAMSLIHPFYRISYFSRSHE